MRCLSLVLRNIHVIVNLKRLPRSDRSLRVRSSEVKCLSSLELKPLLVLNLNIN